VSLTSVNTVTIPGYRFLMAGGWICGIGLGRNGEGRDEGWTKMG
jgi:hypothetical protein